MSPIITEIHLSDLDFLEYETDLLALLNSCRNAVSLHKEALGHTSITQYAIHLTTVSKSSYTPSYRVPHSRRVRLETAVQGMLDHDIIDAACSSHNAPLSLIPKKQGDYRA